MNTQIKLAAALMLLAGGGAIAQDAPTVQSVWTGVYTADQAARGKTQFENHCVACHGAALGGGDMAPALVDTGFLGKWSGQTAGDLFDRIRTTMPTDDPGSLSGATVSDIVAYIFSQNQFPAGSTELAHDSQLLQQVRIDATKPDAK